MILIAALALAETPPAPAPAPAPGAAPAAAPALAPGFVPAVLFVTTDPLLPQRYRSVPAGKYTCEVVIDVSKEGQVTDVRPTTCEEESFWALATAIVEWDFEPATQDGIPVDSQLTYTGTFEVRSLLPRKHVVGFVGVVGSVGGAGVAGVDGRIHLGEQLSINGGVDFDRDTLEGSLSEVWTPVFHADVAISSPRQHFEHRGIYGMAVGGYVDGYGATGLYTAFRGEIMTPLPGLSFGGDAGISTLFSDPPTYDDVGIWPRAGANPFYPWLKASVIWYAPVPRDRFVVVPRADDPVVYVPPPPEPDIRPDLDGVAFEGVPAWHWSQIEPSVGDTTPTGPGFALYPPGTYRCNVRAVIGEDGKVKAARAESCPQAGRADAEANLRAWEWPALAGRGDVQAVFPAPIFVHRDDAAQVRAVSVLLLAPDGTTQAPPARATIPGVYVHQYVAPVWTNGNRPTRACYVDVDLTAAGEVTKSRWVSGDIEVQPAVNAALRAWTFYPLVVDGELTPARVRISMCG